LSAAQEPPFARKNAVSDNRIPKDTLEALHLNRNAFSLSESIRASISVFTIIALLALTACTVIGLALLFRLGLDALTLPAAAYQEAARNFLFAFAGIFGAPFLVWRSWVAHQQATAALKQARVALDNHVTGIFSRSVELLGAVREIKTTSTDGSLQTRSLPNIESRLGALYSLERLLSESEKDQRAILETLCAYVRENSPAEIPSDEADRQELARGNISPKRTDRSDVQAAVTVIGRRPLQVQERAEAKGWRLDLRESNLVGYDFTGHNFDRADFTDSFLNLAKLNKGSFKQCTFKNTVLQKARLAGADFTLSTFEHCNVKAAEIEDTNFSQATFDGTDLREATVASLNISGANLEEAFGYLEHAIKGIDQDGPGRGFHAQEIIKTVDFFKKAKHDAHTRISQATLDAIQLVAAEEKQMARGPE
jgi:uncharacterized protein YjbI with pentapeptide repeats